MSDKIVKFLAHNGRISVTCADTTQMVEEARNIHDMSPVVTAAFGRLLTITAIMATEMKGSKDKLTVQLKGNGPIGVMIATANNKTIVKGLLKALKCIQEETGNSATPVFRKCCDSFLNHYGAVSIIDTLTAEEIEKISYKYMRSCL